MMPGFAASLSDEQIAAVVAFERVRLAGGNQEEVLADCGLVETEEGAEGGEGAEDGEGAENGEDAGETDGETTDTTGAPEASR